MFGSKKVDSMKSHRERWTISDLGDSLTDNIRNLDYKYKDLFGAYSNGFVALWHEYRYLTTLPIQEKTFNNTMLKQGLNSCIDFVPLAISQPIKARNGTDFFFVGRDLQTLQHAFSVDTLKLNDNEEGLQVFHDNQKIAVFESPTSGQFKDDFSTAMELVQKPISQATTEQWDEKERQEKSKLEAAEREAAQKEEFEYQQRAGFPLVTLTTESPSPFPVSERLGIITAEYAHRSKLLSSAFAEIASIGKDRSLHTQSALKKAKDVVLLELKREAYLLGADAVVAVDLDYSEIGGAGDPLLFIVANGTAVKIKTDSN